MPKKAAVQLPIAESESTADFEMKEAKEHEQQAAADLYSINGWLNQMKLKGDVNHPTDLFGLATRVMPGWFGGNLNLAEMKATVRLEYSTGTKANVWLEADGNGWKTVKVKLFFFSRKNKVDAEVTLEDWILRGLLTCTPQSVGTTKELLGPEIFKAIVLKTEKEAA